MKRPLDIIFKTDIRRQTPTIPPQGMHRLEAALRWMLFMPLPVTAQSTKDPAMVFDDLNEIMSSLHLGHETYNLESNKALLCPKRSPFPDGESLHFAQRAVIWEPTDGVIFRKKTLKVAVGAGLRLLSLTFVPYVRRNGHDDSRFQLDSISLLDGHQQYDVPAGIGADTRLVTSAYAAAAATIDLIHNDYILAENTLITATDPIVTALRPAPAPAAGFRAKNLDFQG